jgi:predicted lactoylglutathione lyase
MSLGTTFANLPGKYLPRSNAFYAALGFASHPACKGPQAACMCSTNHVDVVPHAVKRYRQFTT